MDASPQLDTNRKVQTFNDCLPVSAGRRRVQMATRRAVLNEKEREQGKKVAEEADKKAKLSQASRGTSGPGKIRRRLLLPLSLMVRARGLPSGFSELAVGTLAPSPHGHNDHKSWTSTPIPHNHRTKAH